MSLCGLVLGLEKSADPGSVAKLLRILADSKQPAHSRTYAAATLGGIGAWRRARWSASLNGINYRTVVESMLEGGRGILSLL